MRTNERKERQEDESDKRKEIPDQPKYEIGNTMKYY